MLGIEKGIEVPSPRNGRYRPHTRYPFVEMEVGESFFVPLEKELPVWLRSHVQNAAYRYGKKMNRIFVVRAIDGGFRCWRAE